MFLGGESEGTGLAVGNIAGSLAQLPAKQAFVRCWMKRSLCFLSFQGLLPGLLSSSWVRVTGHKHLELLSDWLGEGVLLSEVPKFSFEPLHIIFSISRSINLL